MSRTWIQTFTGRRVNPLDMRVDDIDLRDIAHALSNQGRFTGHTKWHYSVAQHSIYVARYVPIELEAEALLHDSTETYLGDVARPLKHQGMYDEYRSAEARLEKLIAERFNLPYPMTPLIKKWDQRVGAEEAYQLMNADEGWGEWFSQHDRIESLKITKLYPEQVESWFLESAKVFGLTNE